MAALSDEQLRALRFLARHPGGCTEATLLKQGFTAVQLGPLVYAGLAKLRGVNGCEDPRIDGARGNGDEIHRRRIDAI